MADTKIDCEFRGGSCLAKRQKSVRLELPGNLTTISDLHARVPAEPCNRPCRLKRSGVSTTDNLRQTIMGRHLSLSSVESFVLRRLLLDNPSHTPPLDDPAKESSNPHELSDDILFSMVPEGPTEARGEASMRALPKRQSVSGLRKAHVAGIGPTFLAERFAMSISEADRSAGQPVLRRHRTSSFPASLEPPIPRTMSGTFLSVATKSRLQSRRMNEPFSRIRCRAISESSLLQPHTGLSLDYGDFCASDKEVRPTDHDSSCSSWEDDERDGRFDAWEILTDEYSSDFGFDTHSLPTSVQILGTGAHDTKAHPHVMSPPLLDELMNHLPSCVQGYNFWLKYSLIRDGASLQTLKEYVRSSQYTVLAIETDMGEVFGSFTSSPWRTTFGFFGSAPAFVWKMRQSRQTRCPSLFDQARLESDINVFPLSGKVGLAQVCQHDLLAIGGDDDDAYYLVREPCDTERDSVVIKSNGFAFAFQSDMQRGTTSPCCSFQSPALCGNGNSSSVFCIAGLEVWTLTPCRDVDAAEKLEMARYIAEQPNRSLKASSAKGSSCLNATYGSSDLRYSQEKFFRRVGENDEAERGQRESWLSP